MRNRLRVSALALALTGCVACGSADQQPAQHSGAGVSSKEPIITTMPMDVPSGTELILTLETPVSFETAKPDQAIRAKMAKPVVVAGMEVIPAGAPVGGAVVAAERSGAVQPSVSLALHFNEVTVMQTAYRTSTERISPDAEATKGEDAPNGRIGVGVGTAAVLAPRGKEATIPAGATLKTTITETVRIIMPM